MKICRKPDYEDRGLTYYLYVQYFEDDLPLPLCKEWRVLFPSKNYLPPEISVVQDDNIPETVYQKLKKMGNEEIVSN